MKHTAITTLLAALVTTATATSMTGCAGGSLKVSKPADPALNDDITVMWARDIGRNARTGDWILTRSYSLTGDVITATTGGEDVSHASIYDARTGTIIEALRPTIREVPLESLLDRNQLAIVIRPSGLTEAERIASVERARAKVGVEFDLAGLIGFDNEDKYYCSELVYWASGLDPAKRGAVVTPASLMEFGEVVYYSGKRDEVSVQNAATEQRRLMSSRRRERVLAAM